MSSIDRNTILKKRDESQKKCEELRQKIKEMQAGVIALEERIKVYNEFLKGDFSTGLSIDSDIGMSTGTNPKKSRAPRSTKAEMQKRKSVLEQIFLIHGYMQPKEILAELPEHLGYAIEQHHLRAVLKRFPETFAQDPERHGFWGLLNPPDSESDSDPQSTL